MNRRNESTPSPPNEAANGMGELMRDMVSLVELQVELFRIDCRDGLRRIRIAVALLLFAGIAAVGTVPTADRAGTERIEAVRSPVSHAAGRVGWIP